MGVSYPRSRQGGYPILLMRRYPFQDQDGGTLGTPISRMGYPHPDLGWGYPHLRQDGVPPSAEWGTPWSRPGTGGTPHQQNDVPPSPDLGQGLDGVPPIQDWMGYPCPWLDLVHPISKASTCYAAGGVPLAFTQEDFLVLRWNFSYSRSRTMILRHHLFLPSSWLSSPDFHARPFL